MSKSTNKKELESINKLAEKTDKVLSKVTQDDESVEEYTERELEYIDRYKEITGDEMEDEEIYDIILKYNFDDAKIKREVEEQMKLIWKKGEEYGWTKIENGKKAKPEKKEPEVKVKPRENKYKTNKFYKNYTKKPQTHKKGEEYTTEEVEVQNEDGYQDYDNENYKYNNYYGADKYDSYNDSYNYNYNNYNNYKYNNYYNQNQSNYRYNTRGRGYNRGSYRGRGTSSRGRGTGTGQRYNNYYNSVDALFSAELNIAPTTTNIETQKPKELETDWGKDSDEPNDNFFEEEDTSYKKTEVITQVEKSPSKQTKNTNVYNSYQPESTQSKGKGNTSTGQQTFPRLQENNTREEFNSKDIPSNIRNNLKDIIEDNDSHHNNTKKQTKQNAEKKFFDEFSVHSSSMSIGNKTENKVNPINKGQNTSNSNTITSNTVSSSSFQHEITPQTNNQKTNVTTSTNNTFQNVNSNQTQNTNTKNVKKNETNPMSSPQGVEYPQGYMPYPMYFMPPNMQMQGGMNFDPNQMGGQMGNPMYPMMPMYYFPPQYFQQPEVEDNKGKKGTFQGSNQQQTNEMNQQTNPNFPQMAPFYYYGSQNPYGQQMGYPGMPQFMMNPESNFQQQPNYDVKNMKNMPTNEYPNTFYQNMNYK